MTMPRRKIEGKKATSVEVAAAAGVSQATVARSFSSPGKVAEHTRMQVLEAADALGYVPNAIASSLKSQRTNIIGAVVPARSEYWQHLVAEISQQLASQGSQLLLFTFADAGEVSDVIRSLRQYRVDGVLLASAFIGAEIMGDVSSLGVPAVAFNHPEAAALCPAVSIDNAAGAALLAEHLVATGHDRVAFVGGDPDTGSDRLRYRAASQTLRSHGIVCPYIGAGSFDYASGYDIAAVLLSHFGGTSGLPDALMVAGDELAFGVVDGLRALGVSVPDDVSVTGFDGLPQAFWAGYDLTTLVQPAGDLIRAALALLGQEPGNAVPRLVTVAGELRIGRTTRGATPASQPTTEGRINSAESGQLAARSVPQESRASQESAGTA